MHCVRAQEFQLVFFLLHQAMLREPLPPPLAKPDEVTRDQHFKTTTGAFHDPKHPSLLYGERIHKKAPGHWKVNYVKDLAEKVSVCFNFTLGSVSF